MVETPAVRHLLLNRRTTFTIDLLVMVAAFWLSYLLRFDFQVPGVHRQHAVYQLPLVLAVQFAVLYVSGALAFVWKYVGMAEVPAFVRAGVGSGLFLLLIRLGVADSFTDLSIPISIILMNTLTAFGGLVAVRVPPGRLGAEPEPPARGPEQRQGPVGGAARRRRVRRRDGRAPDPQPRRAGHGTAWVRGRRSAEAGGGDQRAEGAGVQRGAADARAGAGDRPSDRHDRGRAAGEPSADPLDLRGDPGSCADDPGDVRPLAGAGVDQRAAGGAGRGPAPPRDGVSGGARPRPGSWAARW